MTYLDDPGQRRDTTPGRASGDAPRTVADTHRQLDPALRRDLDEAMAKISRFLGDGDPLAYQMAPNLRQAIGAPAQQDGPAQSGTPSPAPAAPPGAAPAATGGGGGTVGRVGEVARATLSAIDFPSFVSSLIQGTFQAVVDSSIQQMEAYANLLKNVAGTVDRFMQDNVSDGMARDYLADQFGNVLTRDTTGGQPRLRVAPRAAHSGELPSFFKDLGFDTASDIDDDSIEQVVVPAARRYLAESRQRTLATMVLMGINRVVVDDGEINAKLQFHIDAAETMNMRFDQTKTTAGNMSGYAGRSPFGAQSVMVNTASLNAQTDINIRTDLTGQVRVKFRSETFPLERFADSAAIQLINSNARVPQPLAAASPAAPAAGNPAGARAAPPAAPPTAPVADRPQTGVAPAAAIGIGGATPVAAKSLAENNEWAPEGEP
ncbi:hypothetical protein WK68_12055 [Burkholderia ubonensis]|uniref:hypothetical protein n=1 Tax=Burkholderia ubonensis TaxID=101571 RepID=UPI00075CE363|nr:hypothetical protein [Burkholderia ubonensis]KVU41517.1 hypothetical protein WK68_12055 [Burkholderia ubonensis]